MLKPLLLLFAGILLALTPAAQCAPAQDSAQKTIPVDASMKNPIKPTADSQTKAKNLYSIDCAMCHGDNGNGQTDIAKSMEMTLTDWTDPATLGSKSDADLFAIIRNGKDKMPPEDASRLNDAGVWNLIIYIRSFSKGHAAAK